MVIKTSYNAFQNTIVITFIRFVITFSVQMPKDNSAEDGGDGSISKQIDVQDVEMATEAFRQHVAV